ncbi:hypothetical protein QBZ16_001187 [Prototheca wickerhamii]|uniref:Glycerol uptake facilitator protein n=1 Tax=Prototheca wickerhamii TaxID=3111 RepID=A0AAD9IFL2_PROWI|nr:hypothetical protein QBZ16_001187 [Prototheca wickerhamii]
MLLAKTKGNGYGWGFLSFGFGLAFGFPTMMFAYISAFFNPAAVLFQWVVGNISGTDFLALSFSELAGAFAGAVLVWLTFLPHFNIVPEPPTVEQNDPFASDTLLNVGFGRHFSPTELNIGSYNNDPLANYQALHPTVALHRTVRDIGDVLGVIRSDITRRREQLLKDLAEVNNGEQRREMESQLRELDQHTRTLDEHQFKARAAEMAIEQTAPKGGVLRSRSNVGKKSTQDPEEGVTAEVIKVVSPAEARYQAELIADQNIKLGIFSTRPAIYAPAHNFLCEFICTVTLLVVVNLVAERGSMLFEPSRGLWNALFGIWVGFYVFLLVLVIGGPTGLAVNPARDLGPRIAHFLLPIPGKGPSEFIKYGWVPVLAPLAGGAAAGGIFLLINKLNHSDVPAGSILCLEA